MLLMLLYGLQHMSGVSYCMVCSIYQMLVIVWSVAYARCWLLYGQAGRCVGGPGCVAHHCRWRLREKKGGEREGDFNP